jgi:hypothetical protein
MSRVFEKLYLWVQGAMNRLRSLSPGRKKVIGWSSVILFIFLGGLVAVYRFLFPVLPQPVRVSKVVWLPQGWTSDQREMYYQTPQGCLIIPYSWFLALEQPGIGNRDLFRTDENLTKYRLLPDPNPKYNPDLLPVGLGKQTIPDKYVDQLGCGSPPCSPGTSVHKNWLTFTCAACHTSQLTYKGVGIRIDGGRGIWNFTVFNTTMANLLLVTNSSPPMFNRFALRVLQAEGKPDVPEERRRVKKGLEDFLNSPIITDALAGMVERKYPTAEGYGRMDALGRGANGQFSSLDRRNILRANAPVSIPPIWYTHDYDWVQTTAAIRQPLGRNVTESWGVNSVVDIANEHTDKLFATSVSLRDMFWMETLISVLQPPQWPENILGPIDREAAKLGQYLYEEKVFENASRPNEEQWCSDVPTDKRAAEWQPCPNPTQPTKGLCARCHAPVREVEANEHGKRYWQLPMYKLEVIGTDPWDAVNFNAREVYTGNLRAKFGGREKVGIGEALLVTTSAIMSRGFQEMNVAGVKQAEMSGFRKNNFRAPLAYPARPLPGYWATPPYLHNGSVPNLYQLLSPVDERQSSFWTGDPEFDPVNVGYRTKRFDGAFEFRTKRGLLSTVGNAAMELTAGRVEFKRNIDGNSNLGHEFRDAPRGTKGVIGPYLSPKERRAIIEYLKVMGDTMPLEQPELQRRKALLKEMEGDYEGRSERER